MLLSILPVLIRGSKDWELTYALLDTASESTLIEADLVDYLGLEIRESHVKLMTIHAEDPDLGTKASSFVLTSLDHIIKYSVERALVLPKLNVSRRNYNWPKDKEKWEHLKDFPIMPVEASSVKILIGMDIFDAHLSLEVRRPPPHLKGPYGLRTPLGWSIVGMIDEESLEELSVSSCSTAVFNEEANTDCLEKFWSTE